MRHGRSFNHLGRTASHRAALLSNMASSLILHKRITTTLAKAKALRSYIEPLLTKSKNDSTHSRRTVFSYLGNKESVKELYGAVADKVANRPGGYTRIIKLQNRPGDNASMCIIELVDFNETLLAAKAQPEKSKTRRSRRGGSKAGDLGAVASAVVVSDTLVADDESLVASASSETESNNFDLSISEETTNSESEAGESSNTESDAAESSNTEPEDSSEDKGKETE